MLCKSPAFRISRQINADLIVISSYFSELDIQSHHVLRVKVTSDAYERIKIKKKVQYTPDG